MQSLAHSVVKAFNAVMANAMRAPRTLRARFVFLLLFTLITSASLIPAAPVAAQTTYTWLWGSDRPNPLVEANIPGSTTVHTGSFRASNLNNVNPRGYVGVRTSGVATVDVTWDLPGSTWVDKLYWYGCGNGGDPRTLEIYVDGVLTVDASGTGGSSTGRLNTCGSTYVAHDAAISGRYVESVRITITMTGSYSYAILHNFYLSASSEPTFVASFTADPSSGAAPLEVSFTDTSTGTPTSWLWDFGDGDFSTAQNPTHLYDAAGTYTVTLTATNADGSDDATDTIFVTPGIGQPGGSLYMPIAPVDADDRYYDDGVFSVASDYDWLVQTLPNLPTPDAVIANTDKSGANVFAVANGTVEDIELLHNAECGAIPINLGQCLLTIQYHDDGNILPLVTGYTVDPTSLFRVTVTYGNDERLNYYVADAPLYVRIGQSLNAGCIVGKTANWTATGIDVEIFKSVFGTEVQIGYISDQAGVAFIERINNTSNEQLSLIENLVLEPNAASSCNADPAHAECLGDPQFSRPVQWDTYGGVEWVGDGVIVRPGAYIAFTNLPLNESLAYSFSVNTERVTSNNQTGAVFSLSIGLTEEIFTLTQSTDRFEIASSIHSPDAGSLYTLRIAVIGNDAVKFTSNCLTDGAQIAQPSACYFRNPSFDQGLTAWSVTGGVTRGEGMGEVYMPTGSTIAQSARLYPQGGSSYAYLLEVEVTLYAAGMDISSDTTSTVLVEYLYPSTSSWEPLEDPSTGTTGAVFAAFNTSPPYSYNSRANNTLIYSALITIDDLTLDMLKLRVTVDASGQPDNVFSGTIAFRSVCINDPFAEWEEQTGFDLPFTPSCSFVSPPTTDTSVGQWTWFLWSSMDRFFQCDLMKLLNRLYMLVYDGYKLMRWFGLYAQAVISKQWSWVGDSLIPWFNGHFNNMARGRLAVVEGGGGDCHDMFCLLGMVVEQVLSPIVNLVRQIVDAVLSVLVNAAQFLFDLLSALISLMLMVLQQIMNLVARIVQLAGHLLTAWNTATPTAIPGMPTCAVDPKSNAMCITFWIAEHTIFSGRGALIIPLLIGFASANLLIWAIRALKNDIGKVSESI